MQLNATQPINTLERTHLLKTSLLQSICQFIFFQNIIRSNESVLYLERKETNIFVKSLQDDGRQRRGVKMTEEKEEEEEKVDKVISCRREEVIINEEEEKGELVIGGKEEDKKKDYLLQWTTEGKHYQ